MAVPNGPALAIPVNLQGVNVEKVGSTDSESFRKKKIPVITIHSLTQNTLSVIHSRADQMGAVDWDQYYETYRLLSAYLTLLDDVWPPQ